MADAPAPIKSFRMSSKPDPLPPRLLGRHWFFHVSPGTDALPDSPAFLQSWWEVGRPAIIRRPCWSEDFTWIEAGIALPPPQKLRCPFRIPRSAVRDFFPPPLTTECPSLQTNTAISDLASACADCDETLRVFGSHAWQALTDLPYVQSGSDVDLVLFLKNAWSDLLPVLRRFPLPSNFDLEIVLSDGSGFLWREFMQDSPRILFKGNQQILLGDKSEIESRHQPVAAA